MPEFTAQPRTVKAIQWTGEPLTDAIAASIKEVCGGLPHMVDPQGVLRISGPHGTVSVFPAIPEHEYAGETIPARAGQHVTIDETGHLVAWPDDAFQTAFAA